jgi:hypothetical protein
METADVEFYGLLSLTAFSIGATYLFSMHFLFLFISALMLMSVMYWKKGKFAIGVLVFLCLVQFYHYHSQSLFGICAALLSYSFADVEVKKKLHESISNLVSFCTRCGLDSDSKLLKD